MTRQDKINHQVIEADKRISKGIDGGWNAIVTSTKLTSGSKNESFGFGFTKDEHKIGDVISNKDGSISTIEAIVENPYELSDKSVIFHHDIKPSNVPNLEGQVPLTGSRITPKLVAQRLEANMTQGMNWSGHTLQAGYYVSYVSVNSPAAKALGRM